MAKIVLSEILGGFSLSKINANFTKIMDHLNNKVLYRDNPIGETNTLQSDIDCNNRILYNLPTPTLDSQPVTKGWLEEGAPNNAAQSATEAAESAAIAEAAAASLPNAITAGSNKFLKTDATGTLWEYLSSIPSNYIDFIQSGTGAVSRMLQDRDREVVHSKDFSTEAQATSSAVSKQTGGFWADHAPAPFIKRIPGRLFIGNAVASSGNDAQTAPSSWVNSAFGAYWFERGAQTMSLPEGTGYIGSFSAARTSTVTDALSDIAIGVAGLAWNDLTATQKYAWGGYFEVSRENNAGWIFGIEISVKNKGDNHLRNPYAKDSGGGLGVYLGGGGDSTYNGSPLNPSNTAIVVCKNSHTWNTGICFDADALTGCDGVTGFASAMKMAKGHQLNWFCDASNLGAQIFSSVSTGANKTKQLQFADNNIYLGLSTAGTLFNFAMTAGAVNGFQFAGTTSGTGYSVISATGTDTNLDIYLSPKGTGLVRFGTYTGGAVTTTGYFTIKDAAGSVFKIPVGV